MVRLFGLIRRLTASDVPVLITGETGTGKELAAAALHSWSPRREKPFVVFACTALPESLFESELFGHEKGAYTSAVSAKPGILETAAGGTVLLDEIGELPSAMQTKLLRVLDTGRFWPLGATSERNVDVRFVAATNRNLEYNMRAGLFREDLFFRLGGSLCVPPLRDRRSDIPAMAVTFLTEACRRARRDPLQLSDDAMQFLIAHHWPGNVRELRTLMGWMAATLEGPTVDADHLREQMPIVLERGSTTLHDDLRKRERERIVQALRATSDNETLAAELLGISRRTLLRKLKLHGLLGRLPPE